MPVVRPIHTKTHFSVFAQMTHQIPIHVFSEYLSLVWSKQY
jgi:hypothetical protein